jgi:hypothetical protein
MQAAVKLIVGRLELVPDLGLGAPRDLAPDALAVRTEANRDRADIAVLRRVEVDRVLAVTATARCCPMPFGSEALAGSGLGCLRLSGRVRALVCQLT